MIQVEIQLEHRHAALEDVRLHYVEAGTGPLVILLHGFPQCWLMWRHQIPTLAEAGYRVVAPDMRGYNLSDQPPGVRAYSLEKLTRDVAELIRWCGEERAVVVGHDWGAAVAWEFAMAYPAMVEKLGILNVPHPEQMGRWIRTPLQLLKSSYIFFFQLPWLPERLLQARDYALLRRPFERDPLRPDTYTPADVERYVAAARRSGLRGPINYYRAAFRRSLRYLTDLRPIDAPTLVIWGMRDRYIRTEMAAPRRRWVPNLRVEYLARASHWVAEERPTEVNALLVEFLKT